MKHQFWSDAAVPLGAVVGDLKRREHTTTTTTKKTETDEDMKEALMRQI